MSGVRVGAPLAGLLLGLAAAGCVAREERLRELSIVGAYETVRVREAALEFRARIDPEIENSAIRAFDARIDEAAAEPILNIGRRVRFRLVNDRGEEAWVNTLVVGLIGDGERTEQAVGYRVPLTLKAGDLERVVYADLLEPAAGVEVLIVGRDWLRDDVLVDGRRRAPRAAARGGARRSP